MGSILGRASVANIQVSKLGCVVLSDCISTTGKYYCFLGEHLVQGKPCYDVAAMAVTSRIDEASAGVAIRRHHHDRKAEALAYWQEFRDKMTAPRPNDESDEPKERMVIIDGTTKRPYKSS